MTYFKTFINILKELPKLRKENKIKKDNKIKKETKIKKATKIKQETKLKKETKIKKEKNIKKETKKIPQLLWTEKKMQPLQTKKNHTTSGDKKKITQPLGKKKFA